MLSFLWANTKLKLFSPRCYLGPELMRVLLAQCEVVCQEGTGGAAIPRFAMPVWKGKGGNRPPAPFCESRQRRGVHGQWNVWMEKGRDDVEEG